MSYIYIYIYIYISPHAGRLQGHVGADDNAEGGMDVERERERERGERERERGREICTNRII
jgi:hypothetical protein